MSSFLCNRPWTRALFFKRTGYCTQDLIELEKVCVAMIWNERHTRNYRQFLCSLNCLTYQKTIHQSRLVLSKTRAFRSDAYTMYHAQSVQLQLFNLNWVLTVFVKKLLDRVDTLNKPFPYK